MMKAVKNTLPIIAGKTVISVLNVVVQRNTTPIERFTKDAKNAIINNQLNPAHYFTK